MTTGSGAAGWRTKEKLIALLEEQKKALIQEAVTGQLDARAGRPYPTLQGFRRRVVGRRARTLGCLAKQARVQATHRTRPSR